MSIQRWQITTNANGDFTGMGRYDEGYFVTYADHLAAIAEAEQRSPDHIWHTALAYADYLAYQRALDAAWDAVAALGCGHADCEACLIKVYEGLTAIDTLKEKT